MAVAQNVQLTITANDQASSVLKKVQAQANTLNTSFKRVGSGLADLGRTAIKSTALIGTGLTVVGGFALKTAGDFERMKVALTTSFQGSAEEAEAAFKQINEFTAKTPFQLEEVMTGFIKLKNMGLDPSERALESYGNTASAMGKNLNDIVEAVADAATGEFERLKEFGIRASQQGDKVKFTFKGVETTVKKNSKDIENYLINLGETNFAGGMEAQSKTLFGLFSTLKDNIALTVNEVVNSSGVLDIFKNAIGVLSKIIDKNKTAFIDLIKNGVGRFISIASKIWGVIKPVVKAFMNWAKQGSNLKNLLTGVFAAIGIAIAAAVVAFLAAQSTIIAVIAGITAVVTLLKTAWDNNWGGIQEKTMMVVAVLKGLFMGLVSWFQANWPMIQQTAMTVFNTISDLINTALVPTLTWLMEKMRILGEFIINNWDTISNVTNAVFTFIKDIIVNVISFVAGIIKTVLAVIRGDWKEAWEGVKQIFEAVWNIIKTIVMTVLEVIKSVIILAWEWIKERVSSKLEDLRTKISDIWLSIKDKIATTVNTIKSFLSYAWSAIKALVVGVMNGLYNTVLSIWENLKSGISDKINTISSFLSSAWNSIKSTAVSAWNSLVDSIVSIFDGVLGPIGDVIDTISGWISSVMDSISDAKSAASSIDANAFGGPVTQGVPTMVGERGPEVFVPSQSGSIKTLDQVDGGGGGVTININNPTVRNDGDLRLMALELEKVLSQNNLISKQGIAVG